MRYCLRTCPRTVKWAREAGSLGPDVPEWDDRSSGEHATAAVRFEIKEKECFGTMVFRARSMSLKAGLTRAVCICVLLVSAQTALVQTELGNGRTTFLSMTPSRLDFGTQPIGTSSQPAIVKLSNTGNSAVIIHDILTSGIDFTQSNDCGPTLPPGTGCNISVTFKPAIEGLREGILTTLDSDSGSPHSAVLSGMGQ
jgi:Transmembrane protein 131-like N-terminal